MPREVIIRSRRSEQNFTDAAGNRLCLRRVDDQRDDVRFALQTPKGLFVIGRTTGQSSVDRGGCEEATWWWVAPYDEADRDGYESLHENGYRTLKDIVIHQGAVDTASV